MMTGGTPMTQEATIYVNKHQYCIDKPVCFHGLEAELVLAMDWFRVS